MWVGCTDDIITFMSSSQLQDGFIHLSTSHQVPGTLERFFGIDSGVGDSLVLMALPRVHISDPNSLKFEPAAGTLFGHIYGVCAVC